MTRVIVRRLAKHDIRQARDWYRRISRDLGDDFIRRVDGAITLAAENPLAYQIVYRSFRRVLVHRFPYAVFYHVASDRIAIVAVLHQARDPNTLHGR